MGFWDTYRTPVASRRFQIVPRSGSLGTAQTFPIAKAEDVPALLAFLETWFGNPPHTPAFRPVIRLSSEEEVMYLRNKGTLQATIRYKFAGMFEGQPIYLIDCFCIHPDVRRTGIGTRLLSALHDHTGSKAMLFLKEGRPVPGQTPLYSSTYVFRRVTPTSAQQLAPVSPSMASRLVQNYRALNPDTFWLHSVTNPNQCWRLWKQGLEWGLACFQDAYQTHPEGGRIGWMTALFCTAGFLAVEALVDAAPYDWIWTDRVWGGSSGWTADGPFHWYTYRWTTTLVFTAGGAAGNGRPCYGIVV